MYFHSNSYSRIESMKFPLCRIAVKKGTEIAVIVYSLESTDTVHCRIWGILVKENMKHQCYSLPSYPVYSEQCYSYVMRNVHLTNQQHVNECQHQAFRLHAKVSLASFSASSDSHSSSLDFCLMVKSSSASPSEIGLSFGSNGLKESPWSSPATDQTVQ